jgi:hypothetical protein
MTPEAMRQWAAASRAASGVPPKIEDPAVLARLVVLAFAGTEEHDGGPAESRRRHREAPAKAVDPARRRGQPSATRQRGHEKPPRTAERGARP